MVLDINNGKLRDLIRHIVFRHNERRRGDTGTGIVRRLAATGIGLLRALVFPMPLLHADSAEGVCNSLSKWSWTWKRKLSFAFTFPFLTLTFVKASGHWPESSNLHSFTQSSPGVLIGRIVCREFGIRLNCLWNRILKLHDKDRIFIILSGESLQDVIFQEFLMSQKRFLFTFIVIIHVIGHVIVGLGIFVPFQSSVVLKETRTQKSNCWCYTFHSQLTVFGFLCLNNHTFLVFRQQFASS